MNYLNVMRDYFRENGMNQGDIAEKIGVSKAFVSGILTGKFPIGRKTAQRLSEAFGFSTIWLLTKGEVGTMLEVKPSEPEDLEERIKFLEEKLDFYKKQTEILQEIVKKKLSEN